MKLAEMQSRFQAAILSGGAGATLFAATAKADAESRLAIYADAYRLRLAEILSGDFPALRVAMGDEQFGALIESYIETAPSRTRNARWYGSALPDFLAADPRWRNARATVDLARFERALADAFDAPDAEPLTPAALAHIAPEGWPALVFVLHPSARLDDYADGVEAMHAAALADEPAPPAQTGVSPLLIWRLHEEPQSRRIDADEAVALQEILRGETFGALCAALAFRLGQERALPVAAGLLARWLADGLIVALVGADT
ncbi:MAG: putative DNA-binding domain-containing protein [Hyphomicrobiales bacterium]|nr:putative DNA-binding domain-containing protein [Hyphomicrobiales bacterium]